MPASKNSLPAETELLALHALEGKGKAGDWLTRVFRRMPASTGAQAKVLAAHANAARGLPLHWVIGPLEEPMAQSNAWIGQIREWFDGVAPLIRALPLRWNEKIYAVLRIETDRAPFVWRNGNRRETPWFNGSIVQGAGRSELLRLLVPSGRLPIFEAVEGELVLYRNMEPGTSRRMPWRWSLDSTWFLLPQGEQRIVIPSIRCRVEPLFPGNPPPLSGPADLHLSADARSTRVRVIDASVVAEDVGSYFMQAYGTASVGEIDASQPLALATTFAVVGHDTAATLRLELTPLPTREDHQVARWRI